MDINNLNGMIFDESSLHNDDSNIIMEYTVDPEKKTKLIDTIIHKFVSECRKSKNQYIRSKVFLLNDRQLESVNKNFLYKGGVKENKLRNICIGCYDFRKKPKEIEDPYPELKQIVKKVNSEINGIKISISIRDDYVMVVGDPVSSLLSGILNLIRAGVTKNKIGTLYVVIDKDAIRESAIYNATEFTNEIMNDLFK